MSQWQPGTGRVPLFVHIAGGVFVGLLAAAFVIWRVAEWRSATIAAEAVEALRQASVEATSEQRRAEEAARRSESARRSELANVQQAQELARRQAADETARSEAAWQAFYRKSAACDEAKGGSWTVDCANDFMRAKKKFADLYSAGKL